MTVHVKERVSRKSRKSASKKNGRTDRPSHKISIDGNEAAAYVAYNVNEVIAIYPITPSSVMGEKVDEMATAGEKNIWGTVPFVQEMQSEAGAAGVVHGALQAGALSTTFTSSQGLLLMIPNMYKIAGELTPTVFHVAARSLATHALSIFGDHSDVMAVRSTGFALLNSTSVQEVMDFALIAHAATLKTRIPFVHFFDGFRTSHEINKIEMLSKEDIQAMIDPKLVEAHRSRGLSPDHPVVRGTAQNPDVFFQAREAANPFYLKCTGIVQETMDQFAELTGRSYQLFDYYGPANAERVIVIMGSGAEACQDTVDKLVKKGEKVGLVKVRLYRPFSVRDFINALPKTTTKIAVLDRAKDAGGIGEPLYMDVVNALFETAHQKKFVQRLVVTGGRYGLSSKEFTPAMIKGVYDELLKKEPKNHFTVGIVDDVTKTSLDYDEDFVIESSAGVRAIFFGLGSDGTVSANKNTIKIIGENTPFYAQGYFVYDSKKSGSVTVSHLRFGPKPIHSSYLVSRANFIGCHQFGFLQRYDVLKNLEEGGVFLLNSPFSAEKIWENIPGRIQKDIIKKKAQFYAIDAYQVAHEMGMGMRINTIMQTCFFAISGILPKDEAIAQIKNSIVKTYGKKGEEAVQMNFRAVDHTLEHLHKVEYPAKVTQPVNGLQVVPENAPGYIKDVVAKMIEQRGDELPVSAMPVDGTFPVGTSRWEKRNIAQEIPAWETDLCIQCGKCVFVCPHSVIRAKAFDPQKEAQVPASFKTMPAKDKEYQGLNYRIQVSPEDCTGCAICVDVCPVKSKTEPNKKALNMHPYQNLKEQEKLNWEFFLGLPERENYELKQATVRGIQCLQPLFEFSGACAGCGETPYIRLLSQLFGDRALIANATGCSSIFGGNLPTTPWTKNKEGRGPAWSNSLFEDNAEFGLGFRLAVNQQKALAVELVKQLESRLGTDFVRELIESPQDDETQIYEQRKRVSALKDKIRSIDAPEARRLEALADMLVKKSIWIVGGDGWAYDIGFGGLDHVLSTGENVKILVLDTEVYSNTGGQMSKATPRGAVAKFANAGKSTPKKDLALMAMSYGHAYVANVAFGAKDEHTLRVFLEAERHKGPSLIIAYSHCIAQGITDMATALEHQKAAVKSGYWPLFRYNPQLAREGKNPLVLDSSPPQVPFENYAYMETRFKILVKSSPEKAKEFLRLGQEDIMARWRIYQTLASQQQQQQSTNPPQKPANP